MRDSVDRGQTKSRCVICEERSSYWSSSRSMDSTEEVCLSDRYYLKAMNCPHHHKLFGAVPRSYRDLPLRLAEYGTCYRYEQSGELFGLMRVRAMQMNDAHIYCTEEQFASEFQAVNEMYLKYFKIFGIDRYQFRFSTHDPTELGKKFVDQCRALAQDREHGPRCPRRLRRALCRSAE